VREGGYEMVPLFEIVERLSDFEISLNALFKLFLSLSLFRFTRLSSTLITLDSMRVLGQVMRILVQPETTAPIPQPSHYAQRVIIAPKALPLRTSARHSSVLIAPMDHRRIQRSNTFLV
jgi:hypothetical protein